MLPALLVAATLSAPGAPIPKDTCPNPTGPAPRVLAVKANAAGFVQIVAIVYEKRKVQTQVIVIENGKRVVKPMEQEVTASTYLIKTLDSFGGKFSTADGSALTTEQVTKRVKAGASILVPADGKPIARAWLQAVAGDTVILHTDELIHAHFQFGQPGLPATTAPPRLVMLGTDAKGTVRVAVNPNAGSTGQIYDDFSNFQNVRVMRGAAGARMVIVNGNLISNDSDGAEVPGIKPADADGKKPLADVLFDAYDLKGKSVARAEALKRLKAGGLVLFAGDNRFPDGEYLKVFHEDLLVLVSPEFLFQPGQPNPYDPPVKQATVAVKPAASDTTVLAAKLAKQFAAMGAIPIPAVAPAVQK